jgi:hypothetical protein
MIRKSPNQTYLFGLGLNCSILQLVFPLLISREDYNSIREENTYIFPGLSVNSHNFLENFYSECFQLLLKSLFYFSLVILST